jgi:hypothetical protein
LWIPIKKGGREVEKERVMEREAERERETQIVVQLYSEALDDVKQKASS